MKIYESVIDIVNGDATMLFMEICYTLATEDAERIGVDHVARMSSESGGSSSGRLSFFLYFILYNYFVKISYLIC